MRCWEILKSIIFFRRDALLLIKKPKLLIHVNLILELVAPRNSHLDILILPPPHQRPTVTFVGAYYYAIVKCNPRRDSSALGSVVTCQFGLQLPLSSTVSLTTDALANEYMCIIVQKK